MTHLPIETSTGLRISSVALICATICFLGAVGGLLYLITHYPDQAEVYIRPLIPSLIVLGSSLILYLRSHKNNVQNMSDSRIISNQITEAKDTALETKNAVDERFNGDLDKRMQRAAENAVRKVFVEAAPIIISDSTKKDEA